MHTLKAQILQFIDSKKWAKLEELLLSSNEKTIIKSINSSLYCKEGLHLLNGILKSLECQTTESTSLKSKIYDKILQLLKSNNDTDEKENGKVITLLSVHIETFPTRILVDLLNFYLSQISDGLPFYGSWTELFGKLLAALDLREEDTMLEGISMGPQDRRRHFLKRLCEAKWSAQSTLALLSLLKDVALTKVDLTCVLEKVGEMLREVDYPSVPPIAYNALLLGQNAAPGVVLDLIITFFVELEKHQQAKSEDKLEIDSMEDQISCSEQGSMEDLIEAQGTVILHVTHLAQFYPQLVKEYLKGLQCQWLSDQVFTPFNLALSLSLSQIEHHKDKIIDLLRKCLQCHFQELEMRRRSFWLRDVSPPPLDVVQIFRTLIANCKGEWDQVSENVVVLCFRLLEVWGIGVAKETTRRPMVHLATTLLPLVFKKQPRLAPEVLKRVASFVLTTNSTHFVELMGKLVRASPLALLDHVPLVRDLMEQCPFLPWATASSLLCALHPLLKMSMILKDALIVLLRKMLFAREVENRLTAVRGFLQLLRRFRILGTLPSSQASMSFSSSLSQVSAEVHSTLDNGTNEALCLELLGVLRRVFTQQNEVRSTLYLGLPDVVRANPRLGPNVLRLLHQHLQAYLDPSPDALNPLLIGKALGGPSDAPVVEEPLADLLGCLTRCKTCCSDAPSEDDDESEESAATLAEVQATFDSLTSTVACSAFEDLIPGSGLKQADLIHMQLMTGIIEVLMEESFSYNALRSKEAMKKVLTLYKLRLEIVRKAKERAKKEKECTKSKGKAAASSGGAKNKGKATTSSSKKPHGAAVPLKGFLSLKAAVNMLSVMVVGDPSADQDCLDLFKDNVSLEMFLISVVMEVLTTLPSLPPQAQDQLLPDLRVASALVLKECGRRLAREGIDLEDEREVDLAKSMANALQALVGAFIRFFPEKLTLIFREMSGKSPQKEYDEVLHAICKGALRPALRVLQTDQCQTKFAKEVGVLVQVVGQVAEQMTPSCPQLTDLMESLCQVCQDQAVECPVLAETMVQVLFALTERVKGNSNPVRSLARAIHHRLGDIEQNVSLEEVSHYLIVTETSASGTLAALCSYFEGIFEVVKVALNRARQSVKANLSSPEDDLDRRVSIKLAVVIHALHEILQSALPEGSIQHTVFRTTTKFYACMTIYLKYQLDRYRADSSVQLSEKFEKLVHLCANMIKENSFRMISYTQNPQGAKKAPTARVQKETRIIPDFVYAIEQYENFLVQLACKSGINLMVGSKLTTSRDFRIIAEAITPVCPEEEDGSDGQDSATDVEEGEEGPNENRIPSPPSKKRKKSV